MRTIFLGLVLAGLNVAQTVPVIPKTSVDVVPKEADWKMATDSERWKVYLNRSFTSPGAYLRAFGSAAGDQISNRPRSYGQGAEGYFKRAGNRFAAFTVQDSAEAALSKLANYEPRYVRCQCTGAGPRLGHAIKRGFVTLNANGKQVFDWPNFVSAYGGGVLATTWVKEYKWSAQGLQNGNSQIYFGVLLNMANEFGPEIRRVFRRK